MQEAAEAPLVEAPVLFLAAMDIEASALRRLWKAQPGPGVEGARCWSGRTLDGVPFVLAVSGIGQRRAFAASSKLIDRFQPQAVISFGVAGALAPGWQLLELALCTEVRNAQGERILGSAELVGAGTKALSESGYAWRPAVSVTVDYIAETPDAKLQLYRESSADIVEMESFAIGKAAAHANIPFLCLRSVSDLDEQELPNFSVFMRDNRVVLWRLALHLARHPRDVDPLWHFYNVTRESSKQMATVLPGIAKRLRENPPAVAVAGQLEVNRE
jgi:nucleoside phosphorylase